MAKDLISSFLPVAQTFPARPLTLVVGATFGPFYINFFATKPTLVGTYSVNPTTDVFTLTSHGLTNGTMVQVVGNSPTSLASGLETGELYFICNCNANQFQLTTIPGFISSSVFSVVNVLGSEPGRIFRCGTPYNLTNHKVWAWVKHSRTDPDNDLVLNLSPTITGASLGFGYDWQVTFTKTDTQTFSLEPGSNVWDLLMQFPTGERKLIVEGAGFTIKLPATHPDLIS